MNKYYTLIEKLICLKDDNNLSFDEREVINEACNALSKEGEENA